MTGHRRIPSKIKSHLSIDAKKGTRNLIIKVEEKPYRSSTSMVC